MISIKNTNKSVRLEYLLLVSSETVLIQLNTYNPIVNGSICVVFRR